MHDAHTISPTRKSTLKISDNNESGKKNVPWSSICQLNHFLPIKTKREHTEMCMYKVKVEGVLVASTPWIDM